MAWRCTLPENTAVGGLTTMFPSKPWMAPSSRWQEIAIQSSSTETSPRSGVYAMTVITICWFSYVTNLNYLPLWFLLVCRITAVLFLPKMHSSCTPNLTMHTLTSGQTPGITAPKEESFPRCRTSRLTRGLNLDCS